MNTRLIASIAILAALPAVAPSDRAAAAPAGPAASPRPAERTLRVILDDQNRVLANIAARELTDLLDYAFDKYNIPKAERPRFIAASAADALMRGALSEHQRAAEARKVAAGIDIVLEKYTDSTQLMALAGALITYGTTRQVQLLEFWGENATHQAELLPVAQAIARVFDRIAEAARKESDQLSNLIRDPNDPRLAQVEELEGRSTAALYYKAFNDYIVALATANLDERKTVAERGLSFLKEYQNAERADVRLNVRNRMARLNTMKGDYAAARALFQQVLADKDAAWGHQSEAHIGALLNEVVGKNLPEANKAVAALKEWAARNITDQVFQSSPDPKAARKGAEAAVSMLEYRVADLEFQIARNDAARNKSVQILQNLLNEHKELQPIILPLLLEKMGPNARMANLDPVGLRALIGRAERELAADKPEKSALEQGIAASAELLNRRGAAGLTPTDIDNVAYLLGPFHDRAGLTLKAINAYLDYLQKHGANPKLREAAMTNTSVLLGKLIEPLGRNPLPTDLSAAYERFLEVATAKPFEQNKYAFEYARRLLQRNDSEAKAIKDISKSPQKQAELLARAARAGALFAKVPADHPSQVYAPFYQLLSVKQRLDLRDPDRTGLLKEVQRLSDVVDKQLEGAIAAASDARQKQALRDLHIRTQLLAGALALNEQNEPTRTIQVLESFDEDVKGLPAYENYLAEAIRLRFTAQMRLKQSDKAIEEFMKYMKVKKGDEAAGLAGTLLEAFGPEFERARKQGERERMSEIAGHRAFLVKFLIEWAEKNAEGRKNLPQYQRFRIKNLLVAAEGEQDAKRKAELLDQAKSGYLEMMDPAKGGKPDDPELRWGLANVLYEQANFAQAQPIFSDLLRKKVVGTAMKQRLDEQGALVAEDNPVYWECEYKLMRCNIEIAKKPPAGTTADLLELSRSHLMSLYKQYDGVPGGEEWPDEFNQLRKEILPNWIPPKAQGAATAPAGS